MTDRDFFGGMYIRKYFDLSTAHITSKDNRLLIKVASPDYAGDVQLHVIDKDQGYIVLTPCDICRFEERMKLIDAGFSLALVDLLMHANRHDMNGLWFDADADMYKGFPCFNWEKNDELYYKV